MSFEDWFVHYLHGLSGLSAEECSKKCNQLIQFKEKILDDNGFLDDLLGRSELIDQFKVEIVTRLGKLGKKNNEKLTLDNLAQVLQVNSSVGTKFSKDGRRMCECMAQVHALIVNCTNCGKIICEYEGYGPCTFCNSALENVKISRKKAKSTRKQLEKAEELKTRLLDYDRNSTARTKVHDIASDFEISVWDSSQVKASKTAKAATLKHQQETSRRRNVITIDIENKQIKNESAPLNTNEIHEMENELKEMEQSERVSKSTRHFNNPFLSFNPVYQTPSSINKDQQSNSQSSKIEESKHKSSHKTSKQKYKKTKQNNL